MSFGIVDVFERAFSRCYQRHMDGVYWRAMIGDARKWVTLSTDDEV